MPGPVTMLVTYRPKPGKEKEFLPLLDRHWPTLDRAGLVSKEPPKFFRSLDKRTGRVAYIEIFQWKDEKASDVAHETPEVMSIWEPMGAVLEDLSLQEVESVKPPFGG